jgi:hypothetical protein
LLNKSSPEFPMISNESFPTNASELSVQITHDRFSSTHIRPIPLNLPSAHKKGKRKRNHWNEGTQNSFKAGC